MMQKLSIAALFSAALICPIGTAAELSPAPAALGRLFFSPNQRAELDRARHAPPIAVPKPVMQVVAKPVALPPSPAPEIVTVNGMIQRSDGQSTIWINNKPVSDHETAAAIAIKNREGAGRVTIRIPDSQRSLQMKVGQSADLRTGKISERYTSPVAEIRPALKIKNLTRPENAARRTLTAEVEDTGPEQSNEPSSGLDSAQQQ
ncbi:MAG: hypothetical protein M3Q32_10370 [Pseudomonadota bacterium]|nr:hypothetical protein [Burkholderiales bacterium]MDQ3196739.1 hypothetical protein [Pseudomonadota bacterium]